MSFFENLQDGKRNFLLALSITLEGTEKLLMSKCQKAIEDLIRGKFLRVSQVFYPFDENRWNSSMIDIFYQFCLDQHVLPNLKTNLELTGTISDIEQVKEKYRLILRIHQLELRSASMKAKSKRFNVLLSCSSLDRQTSTELAHWLIAEKYLVSIDFSDEKNLSILSQINRTDVILVFLTWNYLTNPNCKTALETVQSSAKKCIPIVFVPHSENLWLETMQLEERFYEIFEKEIQFRFGVNYDRLFCELVSANRFTSIKLSLPFRSCVIRSLGPLAKSIH